MTEQLLPGRATVHGEKPARQSGPPRYTHVAHDADGTGRRWRLPAEAGGSLPLAMEVWVEVNVVAAAESDAALIRGLVDRIVNRALAGELETWFFFWEPELRL